MILLTAYQYHNRKIAEGHSAEVESPSTYRTNPPVGQITGNVADIEQSDAGESFPSDEANPASAGVATATPQVTDRTNEIKQKAIGLFRNKDYNGALGLLGKIEDPDAEVLVGMGLCYFKLGDYRNSVSFLRRVLDRDSKNFTALKVAAFAYYRLDDIDDSFDNARKGLALHGDRELQSLYDRLQRERKVRQGYTEEDSSHFRILYNGYKQGRVDREFLDVLEDAYRTIGQDLDYFPSDPVTVILYTNRDFYDTTLAPHWSGGLYDGKIRVPVRGVDLREPVVRKVLFHEYTHVLVHYIAHSCPLWINEGLAEYFSTRYTDRTGQLIPLKEMEKSFPDSSTTEVALAYRESYWAVSFLVNKYGLYGIKTMLEGFGAGKGADAAFENAFGITYRQFISSWGKGGNSSF